MSLLQWGRMTSHLNYTKMLETVILVTVTKYN